MQDVPCGRGYSRESGRGNGREGGIFECKATFGEIAPWSGCVGWTREPLAPSSVSNRALGRSEDASFLTRRTVSHNLLDSDDEAMEIILTVTTL